jgi:hypothetical protein
VPEQQTDRYHLHKIGTCLDNPSIVGSGLQTMLALCRAIRVVCLHDVSMIAIGVEGADQGEEEPSCNGVRRGGGLR